MYVKYTQQILRARKKNRLCRGEKAKDVGDAINLEVDVPKHPDCLAIMVVRPSKVSEGRQCAERKPKGKKEIVSKEIAILMVNDFKASEKSKKKKGKNKDPATFELVSGPKDFLPPTSKSGKKKKPSNARSSAAPPAATRPCNASLQVANGKELT